MSDWASDIESFSAKVVATALVDAVADQDGCKADITVTAGVCECKENRAECKAIDDDTVFPCCVDDHVWAKRGRAGKCVPKENVRAKRILQPTCGAH